MPALIWCKPFSFGLVRSKLLEDFEVVGLLETELTEIFSFALEVLGLFTLLIEWSADLNDGEIGLLESQVLVSLESQIWKKDFIEARLTDFKVLFNKWPEKPN